MGKVLDGKLFFISFLKDLSFPNPLLFHPLLSLKCPKNPSVWPFVGGEPVLLEPS